MKLLYSWSKWLHKYVGLCFFTAFFFTACTGILINHPSLLSGWSVPTNWLGLSYQYSNWNRFSFRDSLLLDDGSIYIAGKMGVFYSPHSGTGFQEMNSGLPESLYLRDSNCLLTTEYHDRPRLYVGGRSGLFFRDHGSGKWRNVSSVGSHEVVDLLLAKDRILVFTSHGCLSAPVGQNIPVFERVPLVVDTEGQSVPGYRLLFELHSGKLFGLSGRLLVDFSALVLLFLSGSAFYIWYVPWSRRRFGRGRKKNRLFSSLYSYHLTFGVWVAVMFFLIGGSGTLIRPPLILLSSFWQVPFSWLAQETPEILKAAVHGDDSLILATRDGWYQGDVRLNSSFQPISPPLPVFGMGTTVLEPLKNKRLLIGSFSGLYIWNPNEDSAVDLDGNIVVDKVGVRPDDVMAAGAIVRDGMYAGYADYKKGLLDLGSGSIADRPFPMEQTENRTSLYHFLFELHNGRFLRDSIGSFYILYVPLLGMALLLVTFTGVFDWLKRKTKRLRKRQKG